MSAGFTSYYSTYFLSVLTRVLVVPSDFFFSFSLHLLSALDTKSSTMMLKMTIPYVFLFALLFIGIPAPSSGFGGMKNHGGQSSVAEILAAGLITRMLMNKPKPMPVIHHAIPHIIGGYSAMPARHPMPAMYTPRIPMMNPYIFPIMPARPRYNMMNHALMTQASKNQALTNRLNEEIRALEAHESMLEAALARARQGSEKALNDLLSQEESIPAAALLLADLEAAELLTPEATLENAQPLPPPEVFQVAASEPESRYLLPRIVRHFVQRLLRRGQRHPNI